MNSGREGEGGNWYKRQDLVKYKTFLMWSESLIINDKEPQTRKNIWYSKWGLLLMCERCCTETKSWSFREGVGDKGLLIQIGTGHERLSSHHHTFQKATELPHTLRRATHSNKHWLKMPLGNTASLSSAGIRKGLGHTAFELKWLVHFTTEQKRLGWGGASQTRVPNSVVSIPRIWVSKAF